MTRGVENSNSLIKSATGKLSHADFARLAEFSQKSGYPKGHIIRTAILEYLQNISSSALA